MGLFDKLKGKKESVDWGDAYHATPKFYKKPDGNPFYLFFFLIFLVFLKKKF